ncbi:MAG: threonine--tRNA ligase [Candidatus Korobacteraceae bacterium]|jgi:threonyl-tRNA synthetase
MSDIKVQLPDGSVQQVPQGTTPLEIARSISPRLADAALVARTAPIEPSDGDGDLTDLTRPLERDTRLRLLTDRDPEALQVYRHSSAHLMAAAVLELFPETKLGHGPATESGFFYDFYRPTPFTPEDLEKIEKKMQEIVQRNEPYAREFLPREEGLTRFKAEGDFMKCHFIEEFTKPDEKISLYKTGKFVDFCRGPHIPSTGKIKAFKLLSIAGAYWLGKEENPQLQRIYGTAFFSKKDLEEHMHKIEEAKRRDHRVLGKQLDLFSIQELAGPGLIFWHPKGGIIRKEMEDWMREEYLKRGYSLVVTPHVARMDLWKTSGHAGYYAENFFTAMKLDDAEYMLKPMNCPGHILIYRDQLRSYRDLPMRLGELGTVYRYERSGVMHGLMRVRGFTQDDAHIFCAPDQIKDEIAGCLDFAIAVLHAYGFEEFKVELSAWDPNDRKSYIGTDAQWELAQTSLKEVLEGRGIPYKFMPGEAAFYGPKIDVKLVDAIGRLWQLSTVQFDFTLPQRFGLEYVGEDGQRHQPLMVHRALYGSVERFFGVLIEHYAGAFPLWLSPTQVEIVPIAERHVDYANKVRAELKAIGARVEVDARNEKMNAKIREHAMQKVPFILVVGDKEQASGEVNVRVRGQEKAEGSMATADFVARVKRLKETRSPGLE